MEIPTWPAMLPVAPLLSSYKEDARTLTKAVTSGNKSMLIRRVSTRAQTPISVSFNLTKDQVNMFESFFYDVLAGGALRFSFVHPRKGTTIEVSFDPSAETAYTIEPQESMAYFKVNAKFLIWS